MSTGRPSRDQATPVTPGRAGHRLRLVPLIPRRSSGPGRRRSSPATRRRPPAPTTPTHRRSRAGIPTRPRRPRPRRRRLRAGWPRPRRRRRWSRRRNRSLTRTIPPLRYRSSTRSISRTGSRSSSRVSCESAGSSRGSRSSPRTLIRPAPNPASEAFVATRRGIWCFSNRLLLNTVGPRRSPSHPNRIREKREQ